MIAGGGYALYTWATGGTVTFQNVMSAAAIGATAGWRWPCHRGHKCGWRVVRSWRRAPVWVPPTAPCKLSPQIPMRRQATSCLAALGRLVWCYEPLRGFWQRAGAMVGGGIEKLSGGNFLGRGYQVGGLVGGLAGGFYNPKTGLDTAMGLQSLAWQGGGMAVGGAIGYAATGTFQGTLLGMNFGMMGGSNCAKCVETSQPSLLRRWYAAPDTRGVQAD